MNYPGWPKEMHLAMYLGEHRMFDNRTTASVRSLLIAMGEITEAVTLDEVAAAREEGRRLLEMYTR